MAYAAYESCHDGKDVSFKERDLTRGILGQFNPRADPVAVADTLDELRLKARAHLGEFPDVLLYLVDSENLVHERVLNKKHHEAVQRAGQRAAISIGLLVLCFTCLVGTPGGLERWGPGCFIGISVLYIGIVKAGLFNEAEGAVVCEILLIILLILTTTLAQSWAALHGSP